jgi:hypothetical protein
MLVFTVTFYYLIGLLVIYKYHQIGIRIVCYMRLLNNFFSIGILVCINWSAAIYSNKSFCYLHPPIYYVIGFDL